MTTQFDIPEVGSKVNVTSQFKSIYFRTPGDMITSILDGVVIPNHKTAKSNTFLIRVSCPTVPVREVNMRSVIALKYSDGSVAKKGNIDNKIKTLVVKGSKGDEYTVIKEGKTVTCNCVGFQFRKTCKHLEMIK